MTPQVFLKQIQARVNSEFKRLQNTGVEHAKQLDQCKQFEKEFLELCEKHNMAGQVFAINHNVPTLYQSMFTQIATKNFEATECAMAIQQWFVCHKFGASVCYALSVLTQYLQEVEARKALDKSMPLARPEAANKNGLMIAR